MKVYCTKSMSCNQCSTGHVCWQAWGFAAAMKERTKSLIAISVVSMRTDLIANTALTFSATDHFLQFLTQASAYLTGVCRMD